MRSMRLPRNKKAPRATRKEAAQRGGLSMHQVSENSQVQEHPQGAHVDPHRPPKVYLRYLRDEVQADQQLPRAYEKPPGQEISVSIVRELLFEKALPGGPRTDNPQLLRGRSTAAGKRLPVRSVRGETQMEKQFARAHAHPHRGETVQMQNLRGRLHLSRFFAHSHVQTR